MEVDWSQCSLFDSSLRRPETVALRTGLGAVITSYCSNKDGHISSTVLP